MDKRRLVRRLLRLQNRLINPPMCWAIDHGLMPPTYSLPDDDAYKRQRHLAHGRPGYQLDGILLRALATDNAHHPRRPRSTHHVARRPPPRVDDSTRLALAVDVDEVS